MINRQLHPLSHILVCLSASSMVLVFGGLAQLGIIALFSLLYASFRINGGLPRVFVSLVRSLPFILSIALIQLLFNRQGSILWQFKWFHITTQGAYWAAVFALRLSTIILCAKALAVLSFAQFQAAFASLRIPEEFSFMISHAVHLIPLFTAQIRGFNRSLLLRGIELKRQSLRKRIQIYKLLAIAALAGVITGSTTSAIALELRGFRSKGRRSYLHRKAFGVLDVLVVLCLITFYFLLETRYH